jgi:tRNA dimethylallyltransferase
LSYIPIIVGPTGSGKTAVGLKVARALEADVISADSRQVYKGLQAGTAKPEGRRGPRGYVVEGVVQHLMDILEPTERFSAGDFARQAGELLGGPGRFVIVGGTGLYLRALVDGLAPLPPRDEAMRRALLARAEREGRAALHAALARVDPPAARAIPPNNIARVVRALEVRELTGKPLSWWQKERTVPSTLPFLWFGLAWEKEALRERLEKRCRKMVPGLLAETESLLEAGVPEDAPAFQSLGYRAAVSHLRGKLSAPDFEAAFFRETKLYVKRQLTWFRANPRIRWIPMPSEAQAARVILAAVRASKHSK